MLRASLSLEANIFRDRVSLDSGKTGDAKLLRGETPEHAEADSQPLALITPCESSSITPPIAEIPFPERRARAGAILRRLAAGARWRWRTGCQAASARSWPPAICRGGSGSRTERHNAPAAGRSPAGASAARHLSPLRVAVGRRSRRPARRRFLHGSRPGSPRRVRRRAGGVARLRRPLFMGRRRGRQPRHVRPHGSDPAPISRTAALFGRGPDPHRRGSRSPASAGSSGTRSGRNGGWKRTISVCLTCSCNPAPMCC